MRIPPTPVTGVTVDAMADRATVVPIRVPLIAMKLAVVLRKMRMNGCLVAVA